MTRLGPDELKDAMVTLHPQPAMEHLHHRFVAADGQGSDAMIAFEATEVAVDPPVADARPGPPGRAARRRPGPLADPARGQRHRRRRRGPGLGRAGAERRRRGLGRLFSALQDLLPHRRTAYRRVTPAAAKRETQRRAAMAILAFVLVMVTLGTALYAFGGGGGGTTSR